MQPLVDQYLWQEITLSWFLPPTKQHKYQTNSARHIVLTVTAIIWSFNRKTLSCHVAFIYYSIRISVPSALSADEQQTHHWLWEIRALVIPLSRDGSSSSRQFLYVHSGFILQKGSINAASAAIDAGFWSLACLAWVTSVINWQAVWGAPRPRVLEQLQGDRICPIQKFCLVAPSLRSALLSAALQSHSSHCCQTSVFNGFLSLANLFIVCF